MILEFLLQRLMTFSQLLRFSKICASWPRTKAMYRFFKSVTEYCMQQKNFCKVRATYPTAGKIKEIRFNCRGFEGMAGEILTRFFTNLLVNTTLPSLPCQVSKWFLHEKLYLQPLWTTENEPRAGFPQLFAGNFLKWSLKLPKYHKKSLDFTQFSILLWSNVREIQQQTYLIIHKQYGSWGAMLVW